MVKTPSHEPKGTTHFDVKFKSGGLLNRLTAIEVYGLIPAELEWVYLVEQKRIATPEEIRRLCKKKKS